MPILKFVSENFASRRLCNFASKTFAEWIEQKGKAMNNENDKSKREDWEMSVPNSNIPKQEKPDDWTMPAPVFRVSAGEKIADLPKRSFDFNQNDANHQDKITSNFDFSDFSPPYPYDAASPNQKPIRNQSVAVRKTEKAPVSKLIYVLGGSLLMLLFAIIALAGVYFLFLHKS